LIRKTLFWAHLSVAVIICVPVLLLTVTGAMLAFDNQIREIGYSSNYSVTPEDRKLPILKLINETQFEKQPKSMVLYSNKTDAVRFTFGHGMFLFVDPYSGKILGDHKLAPTNFMNKIFLLHGSLIPIFSMETRGTGQSIIGAVNLAALFLLISGLYLWIPQIIQWEFIKKNLFFNKDALRNSKTRDYNWHLVLGIWSSIPLIVILLAATIMEYDWAIDAKDSITDVMIGEEVSKKVITLNPNEYKDRGTIKQEIEQALLTVEGQISTWKTIAIKLPLIDVLPTMFTIDEGNGRQPHKRTEIKINQYTGEIIDIKPFQQKSKAAQNLFLRFLHTGEVFGWWSQVIAFLAAISCSVMIWCGIALAYRRLIK